MKTELRILLGTTQVKTHSKREGKKIGNPRAFSVSFTKAITLKHYTEAEVCRVNTLSGKHRQHVLPPGTWYRARSPAPPKLAEGLW